MRKYQQCNKGKCGEIVWVKYTRHYHKKQDDGSDKIEEVEEEYADCKSVEADACEGDCACFIVITVTGKIKQHHDGEDSEQKSDFVVTMTYDNEDYQAYLPWSRDPDHEHTGALEKSFWEQWKKELEPATATLRAACLVAKKGN